MAELIGGPCDGAEIEDDSVSAYVIPWHLPCGGKHEQCDRNPKTTQPDALYVLNPADGNYHFKEFV